MRRPPLKDRVNSDEEQCSLCWMRIESELWGTEVAPLAIGPVVEVITSDPVDIAQVAATVRSLLTNEPDLT